MVTMIKDRDLLPILRHSTSSNGVTLNSISRSL